MRTSDFSRDSLLRRCPVEPGSSAPVHVCRAGAVLFVLLLPPAAGPAAAQPSGGPYGPLAQRYEVPRDAAHVYYVSPDSDAAAPGLTLVAPTTIEAAQTPLHRFNNDMVFVEGEALRSVGWEGELDAHSLFIDYEAGQDYIGADLTNRLVEITAWDVALLRTTRPPARGGLASRRSRPRRSRPQRAPSLTERGRPADTARGRSSWRAPSPWTSSAVPPAEGRMRLLAVIKEPASIARYLAAVGEASELPRRSPGRGPP